MPTTGLDLKLQRVGATVKQQDLAARMGRSRATLIRYEGLLKVPDEIVTLYLDSLATFRDVAGDPDGLTAAGHGRAA